MLNCCYKKDARSNNGTDSGETAIAALNYLEGMIRDIENAENKTLAYWRIQDPQILSNLQDFCKDDSYDDTSVSDEDRTELLIEETQSLFDRLNPLMTEQEKSVTFFPQQKQGILSTATASNVHATSQNGGEEVVAILFGGKQALFPRSLSESTVEKLSQTCLHVYTVSRSAAVTTTPNVTHFQNQRLAEDSEAGVQGFLDVINQAVNDYFSPPSRNNKSGDRNVCTSNSDNNGRTLVIFYTIAMYKEDGPQKNLESARSFSQALLMALSNTNGIKWKIILTGTDATLPSTHPDTIVQWNDVQTNTTTSSKSIYQLTIPSYKIMVHNYVYAMSKIGQFYTVAAAISTMLKTDPLKHINVDLSDVVNKITQYVNAVVPEGEYNPDNDEVTNNIMMSELDEISLLWTDSVQPSLSSHLAVVTGLSIVYTPLHCRPWVNEAVSKRCEDDEFGSIKARIVCQIVKRLKNAISLDMGVECHLKHTEGFCVTSG